MPTTLRFVATLALLSLRPGGAPLALAGQGDFAVFVTRLGGDAKAAEPYLAKFSTFLEGAMGWPKGAAKGTFLATKKESLALLGKGTTGFAVVEPTLYFELKASQKLVPLVQVESKDLVSKRVHVVVKDPALSSLAALKGKRLQTPLADWPAYLSKVVFEKKLDAATHFALKRTGQALKGVRAVLKGQADATLLDDDQLAQAKKMEGGAALRSIHTSPALPGVLVVALSTQLPPPAQKKLAKLLLGMCGSGKGGEICKEMMISRFIPVDAATLKKAEQRFGE
ncbi:MAG: PhnD/SsuA/transferrin family substrate-binding protein [Deltaproteobacteria bacterium]|nr:PhnD/SsuA/transferrin family substrate-binding protein [Deltaproteobacteria bacterium]